MSLATSHNPRTLFAIFRSFEREQNNEFFPEFEFELKILKIYYAFHSSRKEQIRTVKVHLPISAFLTFTSDHSCGPFEITTKSVYPFK